MLIGARGTLGGGGKKLPYDYEVEWLQGDGKSCVDTLINFSGRNDTTIKFDCTVECAPEGVYVGSTISPVFLFARSGLYRYGVYFDTGASSTQVHARVGTSTGANLVIESDEFRKVSFHVNYGENECSIENVVVKKSVSNTTNLTSENGAVVLFCFQKVGSDNLYSKTKIKRFEMNAYELGSVDFIPVVKDGIGYFYDRVSGKLFGNSAGAGALIIGPKVG